MSDAGAGSEPLRLEDVPVHASAMRRVRGTRHWPTWGLNFDLRSLGLFFAIWSIFNLALGGVTLAHYVQFFSLPHVGIDFGSQMVSMQLGGEAGLVLGALLSLAGGLWMFVGRSWGRMLVVAGVLLGIAAQIVLLFPFPSDAWSYSENAIGTGGLLLFAWVALACTPSGAGGTSPQQG